MTTQHTKGEWLVGRNGTTVRTADGSFIAECIGNPDYDIRVAQEHARLIAAAPQTAAERDELKAELEWMTECRDIQQDLKVKAETLNRKLLAACQKVLDDCAKYKQVQIPAETFTLLTAVVAEAKGE